MAVNLSPIGNSEQFFDNNGIPLNGGLIYTYQAGSSTPLATYTDINGTVANTNPIVLNTAGRLANEVWLTYGFNYKFVLKDSTGQTIGTYDNIYGMVGVQAAVGTTIPAGMISLWYGSIGSVPTGWYLCDGSNGTPDLRDRFIIGAGSSYSVGATGGAATHTLTTSEMPSHTHTATSVVTDPGHFHSFSTNVLGQSGSSAGVGWTGGSQPIISGTLSKTTGITVATTNDTNGSGTSFSILNPYYALAYVMKA
jgi:microcystin-dependent protein